MDKYLEKTKLLDYECESIQKLIERRKWKQLDCFHKILEAYNFVRDEIEFGYNVDDNIPASRVLADGYGQCNTKSTLFMAILRALGVPCRLHGFTIRKEIQKGAMKGLVFKFAPENVVHSWVEVYFENEWYNLEGFILDKQYLSKLQNKFSDCSGSFCGYGVSVRDFKNPVIDWNKNDTYIQKESINKDLGIFNNPDMFFAVHSQDLNFFKKFMYRNIIRHLMNKNVRKIRDKLLNA